MATSETYQDMTQPDLFGSLPEDSRASLFPSPGSSEARAMTVTSGLRWLRVSSVPGQLGCWLRMCLASSAWNSTRCFLTWKPSVTPRGRLLFRLSPSMPRTDATEFGLLPTMTAADASGHAQTAQNPTPGQTGGTTLPGYVRMWPTPTAITDTGGAAMCKWGGSGSRKALRAMATPAEINGSLNPNWVEWLMGYPVGWTDCEDSEKP